MELKIFQVDAFTDSVFKGNPAAIIPLESWIGEETMQKVAIENNLSETAFFKKEGDKYALRWFTPEREIDLCGHATLASAHIIFNVLEPEINEVEFITLSGVLKAKREEKGISMIFPIREGTPTSVTESIIEGIGVIPVHAFLSRDLMIVLQEEYDVKYIQPNFEILNTLGIDGIVVTAKGSDCDFVSRYFVPSSVIKEDPVTGSAHSTLVPYWAKRLNKKCFIAKQLSSRGGVLNCELLEDSIKISGEAITYLSGTISI